MNLKTWLFAAGLVLVSAGTLRGQVVVVNPGVQISEISKADLRDIFLGASSSFRSGSPAVPVTAPKAPAHELFLKAVLDVSAVQFNVAWRKQLFAGHSAMPRAFESEAALLEYIASAPGAIGYVSAPPARRDVKVLTVR